MTQYVIRYVDKNTGQKVRQVVEVCNGLTDIMEQLVVMEHIHTLPHTGKYSFTRQEENHGRYGTS